MSIRNTYKRPLAGLLALAVTAGLAAGCARREASGEIAMESTSLELQGMAAGAAAAPVSFAPQSAPESSAAEPLFRPERERQNGPSQADEPAKPAVKLAAPAKVDTTGLEQPGNSFNSWNLIVVSRARPLPEGFAVNRQVIDTRNGRAYEVDARIAPYALAMLAQAQADGVSLFPTSAYRSVAQQEALFAGYIQERIQVYGMTYEEAVYDVSLLVADPGTSEHHTGLAIDLVTASYTTLNAGFEDTEAFRWLDANAYRYGFILRYPKHKTQVTGYAYEPWHYRFVGTEHAAAIKAQDISLEEYVANLEP